MKGHKSTVLDAQCTTNGVGSYVESEITIFSMELALTVLDDQCTTNGVGSYAGWGITILPMELAHTVPVSDFRIFTIPERLSL